MARPLASKQNVDKLLFWIAMSILAIGIVTRLVVLVQNRDLIIDEANIARNVYERGFAALAAPLSYDQFAPPVFLWLLKLLAAVFGMGEPILRLYPFLSGAGAIIVFYCILRHLTSHRSLWYPLALFAVAHMLIRYSTEVKQYMPDVFVTLTLILLALKIEINGRKLFGFALLWILIGSVAIWASMPAVFVLLGVFAYYSWSCLSLKKYKALFVLGVVGLIWLAQFALYYYHVLRPGIKDPHLLSYHADYFLYPIPKNFKQVQHNWHISSEFIKEAGGYLYAALVFHLLLIFSAIVVLVYRHRAQALLLALPFVAVFVAAACSQFSLLPRVGLFIMPLVLLLVGYGFELFMRIRFVTLRVVLVIVCIVFIHHHNSASKMIAKPFLNEEITRGLDYLAKEQMTGAGLYVHDGAIPAFIYYTQIYPHRQRWAGLQPAHLLNWDANYDTIAANVPAGRAAFLFTGGVTPEDIARIRGAIDGHLRLVSSMERPEAKCRVYLYEK
ncbi:MAG: glycosyltransferase family 39 protein [Bacteroidetes bacterium]|nr:glycosyltransferase family 39 protein [Bacteroidota bacterium]